MAKCPAIPTLLLQTFGNSNEAVNLLIDLYVDCAVRHNGLVDYQERVNGD